MLSSILNADSDQVCMHFLSTHCQMLLPAFDILVGRLRLLDEWGLFNVMQYEKRNAIVAITAH